MIKTDSCNVNVIIIGTTCITNDTPLCTKDKSKIGIITTNSRPFN